MHHVEKKEEQPQGNIFQEGITGWKMVLNLFKKKEEQKAQPQQEQTQTQAQQS